MTPFPYQERDIEHLVGLYRRGDRAAVNGSDPGLGKTLVAVEVMKRLGNPATLAVCPKSVLPGWTRTATAQGSEITPINYELLRTGRTPFGIWKGEKFAWSKAIEFLIFDEVHRAKGLESKTSELVLSAKRQGIRTLAMSATVADSPVEMNALGFLLGLHDGFGARPTLKNPNPTTFYKWAKQFGCFSNPMTGLPFGFYGTDEEKRQHMVRLHHELFPKRGVRTRISDLPDFPEMQITAELYATEDPARMSALYAEMKEALDILHSRAAFDAGNNPMVELLRARQEAELLKVPVFVSLTQDALAQNLSVILFVNFRATLVELCRKLDTQCFIDGTQTGESGARQRERNRLAFQNDEARLIVCNNAAGSEGIDLQDLNGRYPRLELVSPPWSAKQVRQLVGRPRRAGAKSKSLARFIFVEGTPEVQLHKKLASKLDCLDSLNDGDLNPGNLTITGTL